MPELVKTTLLKAVQLAIIEILNDEGMALFKKVIRYPFNPRVLETVKFPIVLIVNQVENKSPRNRLADCLLDLHIEAWQDFNKEEADLSDIDDRLDVLGAEIEKRLVNIKTYYPQHVFIKQIIPDEMNSTTKLYPEDNMGVVVCSMRAKYLHKWGDPYDPARV